MNVLLGWHGKLQRDMAKENNFPVSNERASFPIGGDWVNLKDERARKKLEKTVEMFSDN